MRRTFIFLGAALITVASCSSQAATKKPATTVPASPTAAALSETDHATAQLACFSWTTYDKAVKGGGADTTTYATSAQQTTTRMSDPRWSRVASLPPDEAMRVLGDLCAEIHYHEAAG